MSHDSSADNDSQEKPAEAAEPAASADTPSAKSVEELKEAVIAAIKTCYDPEIPVDIYELGLIYKVDVESSGVCHVDMTLTSPACPVAGTLPPDVEQKIAAVDGITKATVDVVWDPPWTQDRMSEVARLELGMF